MTCRCVALANVAVVEMDSPEDAVLGAIEEPNLAFGLRDSAPDILPVGLLPESLYFFGN